MKLQKLLLCMLVVGSLSAQADEAWRLAPDNHTALFLKPSRTGNTFDLESADGRYFGSVDSEYDSATKQWRPIFDDLYSQTIVIDIAAGSAGQMWQFLNGAWHLRGDASGQPLDYQPFKAQ